MTDFWKLSVLVRQFSPIQPAFIIIKLAAICLKFCYNIKHKHQPCLLSNKAVATSGSRVAYLPEHLSSHQLMQCSFNSSLSFQCSVLCPMFIFRFIFGFGIVFFLNKRFLSSPVVSLKCFHKDKNQKQSVFKSTNGLT